LNPKFERNVSQLESLRSTFQMDNACWKNQKVRVFHVEPNSAECVACPAKTLGPRITTSRDFGTARYFSRLFVFGSSETASSSQVFHVEHQSQL
jgi:hypothetical protein